MEIDEKISQQFSEKVYYRALKMFIESNTDLVNNLKANNEDDEFKTLHKLKGGANMLGLKKISAFIDLAESNPTERQHIENIRDEFKAITEYYLKKHSS